MSPDGRWLFVAGRASGLSVFEIINRDYPYGRLSEVERSRVPGVPGARAFVAVASPSRSAGTRATVVARDAALFRATPRADVIVGDSAGSTIKARGGGDLMCAAGGDSLTAGSGNDRLYGQRGGDRLAAGTGNDRLSGGSGGDRLDGGLGGTGSRAARATTGS